MWVEPQTQSPNPLRPTHPWSRRGVRLVGYLHLSAAKIAIQRRPLSDSIGPVPMEARHRRFQEAGLRTFCLALIVVQNSSLILCTSYSRTLTPAYLPSVAVALGELVKLVVALLLLLNEQGSVADTRRSLASLCREHSHVTMQFAVPACCYTLQNNLWYYALSNLDPITAAVTSQMKVITTAIASVLMLGRRLSAVQWIALALLTTGMVIMQLPSPGAHSPKSVRDALATVASVWAHNSTEGGRSLAQAAAVAEAAEEVEHQKVPHNTVRGALAMVLATVLSAYAGVFLEKLFKTVQLTLWLQSIQLSFIALPISIVCMFAYDWKQIVQGDMMIGFNRWAWLTVALSALGGIAVSMALK